MNVCRGQRSVPSPVGHLAELLLQVLSADVRQAGVQRTALHQAVHRGRRHPRLVLLHVSRATVSVLPLQEVLNDGEELLTGRQTVSFNEAQRTRFS